MRKFFYPTLILGTSINTIASIFGMLGGLAWWLDLFAHFHLHILICGILGICGTIFVERKKPLLFVNLLVVLMNTYLILPYFSDHSEAVKNPNVKLVAWNIFYNNNQVDSGIQYLRQTNADILIISEPTEPWRKGMASLKDIYPYQFHNPECDDIGCAISLLSKHPWKSVKTRKLVFDTPPVIWAQFDSMNGSGPFAAVAVHMRKAVDEDGADRQKQQTIELGKIIKEFSTPYILAGDMNATPISSAFKTILKETGTIQINQKWLATWPTAFGKLGIPIDHLLATDGINASIKLGASNGSDHFPIEAMISIP